MKAVTIKAHGSADVVCVQDIQTPTLGASDICITMKAAALNHLDLFVRGGLPGVKLEFPHVLGSDGAGIVEEIGAQAQTSLKVGDKVIVNPAVGIGTSAYEEEIPWHKLRVVGEHISGTLSEKIVLPAENFWTMPEHLSFSQAAAFPLTFVTAWRMLVNKAKIQEGETLLIHGIGGGVATACLQIAKRIGCRVLVSSRCSEKLTGATEMGAEKGFLVDDDAFVKNVRSYTERCGVNVVVDCVGPVTWEKSMQCLAKGGRITTCGTTTGQYAKTDISRLFWNQLTIFGSTLGSYQDFGDMLAFVNQHKIEPLIDSEYPLNDALEALDRLEHAKQTGKLVIVAP